MNHVKPCCIILRIEGDTSVFSLRMDLPIETERQNEVLHMNEISEVIVRATTEDRQSATGCN